LVGFALGELGLKPWEFDCLTWEEYHLITKGYFIRQAREWERTRQIYWVLYNANVKKEHIKRSPEDCYSLITDKKGLTTRKKNEDYISRLKKAKEAEEKLNAKKANEFKKKS
jgi:hypothetical protein